MKKIIRKEILSKRESLLSEEIIQKSQRIMQQLLSLPLGDHLFIYLSYKKEVDTTPLIDQLHQQGKKIYISRTNWPEHRIELYQYSPDMTLIRSKYGILEPAKNPLLEVDPAIIDTVIVPGVGFTTDFGRLGYGGGFYDKFFTTAPAALKIGVAFEVQLVTQLPLEPHDALLDYLVTEDRVIGPR